MENDPLAEGAIIPGFALVLAFGVAALTGFGGQAFAWVILALDGVAR